MSAIVSRRFRSYGQWTILAALFLVPVVFSRAALDPFGLVKLSVVAFAAVLAFSLWLTLSAERGVWLPKFKLGYAAAAFLGAYALATMFSQNRALSILGVYRRYGGLVPIALYALVMLAMVGLYWEQPGRLKAVGTAIFASSVVVSLYIVIQGAGLDWISWRLPDGLPPADPIGTLGNSNFAGGFVAISLPFVVYMILSSEGIRAQVFMIVLAVELTCLWLTSSRGGMIGAAAGLAVMALFFRDRIQPWARKALAVGAVCLVVFAVVVLWHPGMEKAPGRLGELDILRTDTLEARKFYWTTAWRIFADNPTVGTGPDTYYTNYGRYRTVEDGTQMGLTITDKPHNIFLEYAANSGILGLGTYLAMAGLAIFYAARKARDLDYPHRTLLIAFASSFVAYLAQGFFSIDVPPLALMGWIALGGIAVLADPAILRAKPALPEKGGKGPTKQKAPDKDVEELDIAASGSRRTVGTVVRAATVPLAVAFLILVGSRPLRADIQAQAANSQSEMSQGQVRGLRTAAEGMDKATRLNPLEATYFRSAGKFLQSQAERSAGKREKERLFSQASGRLQQARDLQPRNVFITMDIARLHVAWAQGDDENHFRRAHRSWLRAVALDPTNWQVRFNYASFLNVWGIETEQEAITWRAIDIFEGISRIHPEHPRVWKAIGQSYLAVGRKPEARAALSRALRLSPGDPSLSALIGLTEPGAEIPGSRAD